MKPHESAYESMEWRQVDHEDWCPQKPPVGECHQDDECHCLRSLVLDARSWARHGFEIGQRSCTWSDSGVAPDWLMHEHDYAAFASDDTCAHDVRHANTGRCTRCGQNGGTR